MTLQDLIDRLPPGGHVLVVKDETVDIGHLIRQVRAIAVVDTDREQVRVLKDNYGHLVRHG